MQTTTRSTRRPCDGCPTAENRSRLRSGACRGWEYFASEPPRGTPQGDRFEVLLALIENYETHHHAMGTPEPIAAIKVLEERGITRRQLSLDASIAESKISEVLNYIRPLSLGMIHSLAPILDLPEAVLIPRYPLKEPARRTASRQTRRPGAVAGKRA